MIYCHLMSLLRYIRAALIFIRFQPWVDAPAWDDKDSMALGRFMDSHTGAKLKAIMQNTVLRQQAYALTKTDALVYEAGYCGGQKGLIAIIESLVPAKQLTELGEQDTDPATNQTES